jgi:3D (Asp-Asp-Asp) domain-containing protein
MAQYQQLLATNFEYGTVTPNLSNTLFKSKMTIGEPFFQQTEINGINANYFFGSTTDINIPSMGDYLYRLTLHADLPDLKTQFKQLRISKILKILSTFGITLCVDEYNNILNETFNDNKQMYERITNSINVWIKDSQELINKINNILKNNFNKESIMALIKNDAMYPLYCSLLEYNKKDYCAVSVVNNRWICRFIKDNLMDKLISSNAYTNDFKLLIDININLPLQNTINTLIEKTQCGNTILFKYLYDFEYGTYDEFFKYLETIILGKQGIEDHCRNGAILFCRGPKKKFGGCGSLMVALEQQTILDNISTLLEHIVALNDYKTLLNTLDLIAVGSEYLDFKSCDLNIVCYNLNMLPIVTLINLSQELAEWCSTNNFYEIKMIVSDVCRKVINNVCNKLKNLLPILLQNQYAIDEKLNIILQYPIITNEALFEMLTGELHGLSRYNDISTVLSYAKKYLLESQLCSLIDQINANSKLYMAQCNNCCINNDTTQQNKVIEELYTIKKLLNNGFNNFWCYCDNEIIDSKTYDDAINSIFTALKNNNLLEEFMNNEEIDNIKDALLSESYCTMTEFLNELNLNNKNYELLYNKTKELTSAPQHSSLLREQLATFLLCKMKHGDIYHLAVSKNETEIQGIAKKNNKTLKTIMGEDNNVFKLLKNIYKNKQIKVPYIDNIGIIMIKQIDLYIGTQLLCSDYGERMYAEHLLFDDVKNRDNYTRLVSKNPVYVPLNFWFNKGPESALPLCNLSCQDIKLRVTLHSIKKLIKLCKYCEAPTSIQFPGSILAQYVTISDEERKVTMRDISYNVITLIQKAGPNYIDCTGSNDICEFQYHFRRMVKTLLIAADYNLHDTIKGIEILFDGIAREPMKPMAYYNLIQPYERFTSSLSNNYFVYTFSLDPINVQPLGNLDASNVKNIIIRFHLNKSKLEKSSIQRIKINVYSSFYELLRFCIKF